MKLKLRPSPLASLLACLLFGLALGLGGTAMADLRPFTTDGCSLFPDGLPKHKDLWRQCCIEHDQAYWKGGTRSERKMADHALRACVAQVKEPEIAQMMLDGVRVGGSPYWPTSFRWGYGWPYGRGYKALSAEEQAQAEEMLEDFHYREALTSSLTSNNVTDTSRPPAWAKPMSMPGVPNLHQVSDSLYRSAQPNAEGFKNLKSLGIKTVVSLRAFHSDRDDTADNGLGHEHLFMKTWHPEREDVVRFLKIATDPKRQPLLVHCQHGSDRTGLMVAIYRIAVQGWSEQDAAQEMTEGGFGFHGVWVNLVPWLHALDIESIRQEAGLRKANAALPCTAETC